MHKNAHLLEILGLLEVEDDVIRGLQQEIKTLDDPNEIQRHIQDLEQRVKLSTAAKHFEEVPYFLLLLAYCYSYLNHGKKALENAYQASEKFRIAGDLVGQTISRWILALIYRYTNRMYDYRNELERAIKILSQEYDECTVSGDYTTLKKCRAILEQLQEESAYAAKLGTQQVAENLSAPYPAQEQPEGDMLVIPWLLVYEKIQAGLTGIELVEKSNCAVGVARLFLDDQPYQIYNLRKTSSTDRQVRIRQGTRTGIIKVQGHSMNACRPMPIEENDYVLFFKTADAGDGDIVIASSSAPNGTISYIVKRYRAAENLLLSETSDRTQSYPPLKIGMLYKIFGIVHAVLKPVHR